MNLKLDQVKDAILKKGFKIEVERFTQDIIITTKLVFSTRTVRKNFSFTNRDIEYVKELDKLLNIIYIKEQGGTINPNFSTVIYNLHNLENMFPITYKEIFRDALVDPKHWSKEEVLNAIQEYIFYKSDLCGSDANNNYEKLISYSISIEYPKVVLDVITDELDKNKISVGSYYVDKINKI